MEPEPLLLKKKKRKKSIPERITIHVNDFTLIMSRYKSTNPVFFNSFEAVKKIDNIGVHH